MASLPAIAVCIAVCILINVAAEEPSITTAPDAAAPTAQETFAGRCSYSVTRHSSTTSVLVSLLLSRLSSVYIVNVHHTRIAYLRLDVHYRCFAC